MRFGRCAVIAVMFTAFINFSSAANAQENCPDGETWEVEKKALSKVLENFESYMSKSEPLIINLKALGAKSGQLVVVYSKKYLECTKKRYEDQLSGDGKITVCKRPSC